ncbi:hypothetical protein HYY73_02725 [Candidatus Woesearchaeota archaeon]|nr:hypothetical protein [Candidatus Woesearchaeota archaeon]
MTGEFRHDLLEEKIQSAYSRVLGTPQPRIEIIDLGTKLQIWVDGLVKGLFGRHMYFEQFLQLDTTTGVATYNGFNESFKETPSKRWPKGAERKILAATEAAAKDLGAKQIEYHVHGRDPVDMVVDDYPPIDPENNPMDAQRFRYENWTSRGYVWQPSPLLGIAAILTPVYPRGNGGSFVKRLVSD